MAVLYAENDCNLSDALAFYRVEAYNLGLFSSTDLSLSSTRTIPLTFANAGNLRGILLCLRTADAANDKSVIVTFQEYVTSTWTTRDTITLTAAQVLASADKKTEGVFVPFRLTTPYAVDTTASKWRIQVSQGAGTGNWALRTSDATNPFVVAYCDTAVSFADNDCLIAEGLVTIDQSCTFRGVLGTGDTTRSVCGIAVRHTDPTILNAPRFYVPEPASMIATVITFDGLMMIGAHSGFQVGSVASPVWAEGNQPLVKLVTKYATTYGTDGFSGIADPEHSIATASGGSGRKGTLLLYGQIPTLEKTTLSADAASGQGVLVTTDDCEAAGWAIGDQVYIGKQDTAGTPSTTTHTISAISGTQITITPVLATANRLAGGTVMRMNGYGISYKSDGATTVNYLKEPSNFHIQGVEFYNIRLVDANTSGFTSQDDAGYRSKKVVKNCSVNYSGATSFLYLTGAGEDGMDVDSINLFRGCIIGTVYVATTSANGVSGVYTHKNCATITFNTISTMANLAKPNVVVTNNKFENGTSAFSLNGISPIFTGNYFFGISSTTGALKVGTVVGGTIGGNTYDKCSIGIYFDAFPTVKPIFEGDIFGAEQANTVDIDFAPSALMDAIILNAVGLTTINETYLPETVEGSLMKVIDETAGTVDGYWTYGKYVKCGYGLADTLVWNGTAWAAAAAGEFSIRFRSLDPVNKLKYQDNYPGKTQIGNCKNKAVSIVADLKINNTNFYAGTHTNPTLRVVYDGGASEVTAVATDTIDGQKLMVTFIPTTEIEAVLVTVEMATDAVGSDAYVYLGEIYPIKPEGVFTDTTKIGKWDDGYPLGTMRTFPAPGSAWDELETAHSIDGSFGKKIKDNFATIKGEIL